MNPRTRPLLSGTASLQSLNQSLVSSNRSNLPIKRLSPSLKFSQRREATHTNGSLISNLLFLSFFNPEDSNLSSRNKN